MRRVSRGECGERWEEAREQAELGANALISIAEQTEAMAAAATAVVGSGGGYEEDRAVVVVVKKEAIPPPMPSPPPKPSGS